MRRYIQRRWGVRLMKLLWGLGDPNAREYETRPLPLRESPMVGETYGGRWKLGMPPKEREARG